MNASWALAELACDLDREVTLGVELLGPTMELRAPVRSPAGAVVEWCGASLVLVRVPGETAPRWVNAERLSIATRGS